MGFRTLEISQAAELHIKNAQLEIISADGIVYIPLEDISQIMVHGANIRLSTMDLSIFSANKISLMTLDEKYLPTAIVLPFEGNSRQSKLMHIQAEITEEKKKGLWIHVITHKVINQSRALTIMGLEGAEEISEYIESITSDSVDYIESLAAKDYFSYYHEGLNRRLEDPVNSRLNYGYAVLRSAISRSLVASGFHTTFGIHHDSQLNAFNLADDLIEPFRPIVDVIVHKNIGSNVQLTKSERHAIAHVLHDACIIDGVKVSILSAIDVMVESLKRIMMDKSEEEFKLPIILPIESMEGITE